MKDTSRISAPVGVQKLFYHIDTRLHQHFLKKNEQQKYYMNRPELFL